MIFLLMLCICLDMLLHWAATNKKLLALTQDLHLRVLLWVLRVLLWVLLWFLPG